MLLALALAVTLAVREGHGAGSQLSEAAQDPRWTQFTQQKDGLTSNNIWAILANEGDLWFGGAGGLSRFNGVWTSYRGADGNPEQLGRLAGGLVQALAKEPTEGTIWAGADNGVVVQWNGSTWVHLLDLHSPVLSLASVAGELWIGTTDGLYRFDGIQPVLVDAIGRQAVFALLLDRGAVWVGAQDGLWRHRGGRWSQVGSGDTGFAGGVYDLLVDRAGALVVGTPYGVGWQLREGASWQWYETVDELGKPALVQALVEDHQGTIWAGTDGAGVFALRLGAPQAINLGYTGDPNLTTRFVRDLAVDRDGSLWLATPVGVFRYQGQMWVHELQGDDVEDPLNYINDLLVDRSGDLWVATGGGGVRRKSGPGGQEALFGAADGVSDTVLVLEQDSTGAIWAGSFEGLQRYAGGRWTEPIPSVELPHPTVTTLLAEGAWLWIGTEAGLARYQVTDGALAAEPALTGQSVEALALDNMNRLWVGTLGSGVWLREAPGRWRQFRHDPDNPESLPGDFIGGSGLAADPTIAGGMWAIVLDEGLARWDGARWRYDEYAAHLPSNLLWTLYSDPSDGSLWIGSEAGVTRFDGLTWGTLTAEDGLQSAVTYAVERARDGGYWIGGRTGLTYFRPDRTAPWVEIGELTGVTETGADGRRSITLGQDLIINFRGGDLQTPASRLKLCYRIIGPAQNSGWQIMSDAFVTLRFDQAGDYSIEFLARDHSFNYSEIASLHLTAIEPPVKVEVPVLGPVESGVFRALIALGSIALLGAGYVTLEVLNTRRRGLEAVARGYNPYISGEPVRRDDMFFGRRDLVQRIVDTLHNNSIMIYGERRIGKTTLLYQLVTVLREVADPDYWFVPIYVDLEGTPHEYFFHYLMEEIVAGAETLQGAADEITPRLQGLRVQTTPGHLYTDRDFYRDLNRVTEVLEEYGFRHDPGKQLRIILLMDEMDVMSKYPSLIQQQLRRIFMREFAATLGAVVAGIQISKDWDRVESPWYNLFNEIALTPFTREQAIELLIEPVRGYYRYEPAAIEFILDHAEGRPYKIQQYGLEAVNQMLAHRRRRITLADVEAAHQRIQAADADLERNRQPASKRKSRFPALAGLPIGEWSQGASGEPPAGEQAGEQTQATHAGEAES
ncbi:MAG TPA: hypothetical protein VNK95_16895 [Caldilineaceae bacterium]|nr:hypothetical protein [Caldilineaceae bacterium]